MSKKCSESPRLDPEIDTNPASYGSHPPAIETNSLLNPPSPAAHDQSPAVPSPATSPGIELFQAMWRSPDRRHQLGTLDRQTNKFKNLPVKDAADAAAQALQLSSAG